ncbi:MAG: ATP-dependent DNA ligase [Bacteroidota bacterium]
MQAFTDLFIKIDQTTKTNAKVDALVNYFDQADESDKLWTMAILSHRRPKRTVSTTLLRTWAAEISQIPSWLFEESYHVVGDLAETISLVLPLPTKTSNHSLTYWINYVKSLGVLEEPEKKEKVMTAWESLDKDGRFIFNKLITGGFRIGVSQKLMVKALAKHTQQEASALSHRLMGNWTPDTTTFEELILSESALDDISKPYPFYLAYALEDNPETLGSPSDWQAERKWDGIRGQVIIREGEVFVWSRGEELVTDKYPEYHDFVNTLPNGTVIDGEILAFRDGKPLPFNVLQTRIGRKKVAKKHLQDAPVVLVAYDLLEWNGEDLRNEPLSVRREKLEKLVKNTDTNNRLLFSDSLSFNTWEKLAEERANARQYHSEGLMIKRKDSVYKSGRKRGDWWKWKVDPLIIDAVMIYAQRGHGRRANLYTDYTFAVWDGEKLVPFTKAYSGLTDKEFREVTKFVNKNTVEKFGPVRSVKPELVFEIAFEGINESKRHKSGVALRFPRISRWRQDKPAHEANTIEDLKDLLNTYALK